MIEAKNLRKVYKMKRGADVKALDGVSLKLPRTGMVFLLGKSGSGKSTLLNVLGGLDSFDSGEIIIKGTSAKQFRQSHYDSYRNTYIGFIFQEYNILEELTVGANIALAIELQGRKATNEEVNSILAEVDLEGFGGRKPNELSGGQKQRVAIARALVKKPEIIMADEPTGALDSATGKQVFDTLKKLSGDKLVLIVSHDREFSEQYADRIIELKDGVIISDVEKESASDISDDNSEAESPLTFGDGEIIIKSGYCLTDEDRIAINNYLAAINTGAVMKLDSNKNESQISRGEFKPTDESKIPDNRDSDFKLIKSKLSLKNAFKLGSGALKYKKVRLVFTIILSVIAFTLFGLADTIAAYNEIKTATGSIYDTGVNYASYIKSIKAGSEDYTYWSTDGTMLTPEDIEVIKRETGRDVVGVYKEYADFSYFGNLGGNSAEGKNLGAVFTDNFSGLTFADQKMLEEHGFTVSGRLPAAGKNEIAITKYTYDYFKNSGYKNYTDKGTEKFDINSEEDLIGKVLNLDIEYYGTNAFTIVGIVDTKFDYSRYEILADENAKNTLSMIELMSLTSELSAAQAYSFASVAFVDSDVISTLITRNANKPNKIRNGSLQLYSVVDDSMIVDGEWNNIYGDDGSNVTQSTWYESVNSLNNVKNSVTWLEGPLDTLADNQIIITSSMFSELSMGGQYEPKGFHDPEQLTDFERTMYENQEKWQINYVSLSSIFDSPRYYTAVKYAYENREGAIAVFRAIGWDEDRINLELKDNAIYNQFANLSWLTGDEAVAFSEVITDTLVENYINELIQKYNLSSYVVSDEIKDKLVATFFHNGTEYSSYDLSRIKLSFNLSRELSSIIASKYAAENFEDAKNYYIIRNNITDPTHINLAMAHGILDTYASYLNGNIKETVEGFTPSASVDFNTYKLQLTAEINKAAPNDSKYVLIADGYITDTYRAIKNPEIVGVIPDGDESKYCIIISDKLINVLFGENSEGVYSYAVGAMPSDKGGINEIVKFSKTYTNADGNVKYQLSNNVTLQLDMIGEILELLGAVFLYIGIGFAIFASLMLTNFIGTSIAYKKQEIGILRAIGSRSADVFRIFFAESFIIAMINYTLSLAGTFLLSSVMNNVLRQGAGLLITFLNFGLRQIGVLFLISIGVALVATFLPVRRIAAMKPIDAIKNRK